MEKKHIVKMKTFVFQLSVDSTMPHLFKNVINKKIHAFINLVL